jgi:hypothetical protein
MKNFAILTALAALLPLSSEAQNTRGPRTETRPRLVVRELSVGLNPPPEPDLPPGPCINFKLSLVAVVGREARPYPQGLITIEGTIEDEAADERVLGRFSTEGHRGAAVIAGLLPGQPPTIDPCWDPHAILTNVRTGEVLDRQSYHADPVR